MGDKFKKNGVNQVKKKLCGCNVSENGKVKERGWDGEDAAVEGKTIDDRI